MLGENAQCWVLFTTMRLLCRVFGYISLYINTIFFICLIFAFQTVLFPKYPCTLFFHTHSLNSFCYIADDYSQYPSDGPEYSKSLNRIICWNWVTALCIFMSNKWFLKHFFKIYIYQMCYIKGMPFQIILPSLADVPNINSANRT